MYAETYRGVYPEALFVVESLAYKIGSVRLDAVFLLWEG
jgi:hypothetical protein